MASAKSIHLSSKFQKYLSNNQPPKQYPIPKQNTPYAFAKVAEYIEKDLTKAETYYRLAIAEGERLESAVKDLAGVLHQQGKTKEACELLRKNRHLFLSDITRYQNLLRNLQKQMCPSPNAFNKSVKISGLSCYVDEPTIKGFFTNPSRIMNVCIRFEDSVRGMTKYALVNFHSHSAARKTFEGFTQSDHYKLEWVSVSGEVTGELVVGEKPNFFPESPTFSSDYSYFSESVSSDKSDLVDQLLQNSIFSYLKPSE
mmetsp:Transcript_15997/g.23176  ORF Transcript_15997/g.23176 Transcript_15997/m.23176 type:complete len:256 (-) Transcript_15997:4-771(-)